MRPKLLLKKSTDVISKWRIYVRQPKGWRSRLQRQDKRLNLIHRKLNDNISDINTIVKDVIHDGEFITIL